MGAHSSCHLRYRVERTIVNTAHLPTGIRLCIASVALLLACSKEPLPAPSPPPPVTATGARAAAVAHATSSNFAWVAPRLPQDAAPQEYPARLLATLDSTAVIVPPLAARVTEVMAKPGDEVAVGTAIARVVMPGANEAAATLQAANQSLAVLSKRRTQLEALARDGLVRAAEVATLDLEIAQQQASKLRARAVLAGSGVSGGGSIVLRSPIAGLVTTMHATLGEYRRPEDGPLAEVRSRTGRRIEATLSSAPSVSGGYVFRVGAQTVPVTLVSSMPAAAGIGYQVWFDAGAETPFASGAEGRIVVQAESMPDTWLVPATAVVRGATGDELIVRTHGTATTQRLVVELVRVANADAIVRGALPAGVVIATDGMQAATQLESLAP